MHVDRRAKILAPVERVGVLVELVEDIADESLRHALCGEKGRHPLYGFPCLEQRSDLDGLELDYARSPVALNEDQPFLLELPDRFAHGRSAHAVLLAQFSLVQAFAWEDLTANDVVSNSLGDTRVAIVIRGPTIPGGHGRHRQLHERSDLPSP